MQDFTYISETQWCSSRDGFASQGIFGNVWRHFWLSYFVGRKMHYSTQGSAHSQASSLPVGQRCRSPAVSWYSECRPGEQLGLLKSIGQWCFVLPVFRCSHGLPKGTQVIYLSCFLCPYLVTVIEKQMILASPDLLLVDSEQVW